MSDPLFPYLPDWQPVGLIAALLVLAVVGWVARRARVKSRRLTKA